ncbi:hypothetical protein LZ30DRAFT_689098 [Colletotrichum cereale]|nr:hypothetical protein LZ30DRAFT_689098 [Colletotrichum cereale]
MSETMESLHLAHNETSLSWRPILTNVMSQKAGIALLVPAVGCFLWFLASWQASPLKKYPGPVLAAISADYAPRIKKLHEKHGPVVRLGPNLLDIDFPELVKVIYGTDGKWKKGRRVTNQSGWRACLRLPHWAQETVDTGSGEVADVRRGPTPGFRLFPPP